EAAREHASGAAGVLAWSATGNLLGAWGVAFVCVPYLGTQISVFAVGVASILLSLFWIKRLFNSQGGEFGRLKLPLRPTSPIPPVIVAITVIGLGGAGLSKSIKMSEREMLNDPSKNWVLMRESPYQQIAIWDEEVNGVVKRALALNGSLQF